MEEREGSLRVRRETEGEHWEAAAAGGEEPLKTEVCSDTGVERPWRWESWQGSLGKEPEGLYLGERGVKRRGWRGNGWGKDDGGLTSLPGR